MHKYFLYANVIEIKKTKFSLIIIQHQKPTLKELFRSDVHNESAQYIVHIQNKFAFISMKIPSRILAVNIITYTFIILFPQYIV